MKKNILYLLSTLVIGTLVIYYLLNVLVNLFEGNREFDFYGKVIDQYDKPIVNAKIVYSVKKGFRTGIGNTITTDINGFFSITNQNAVSLSFRSIKKNGYLISRNKHHFSYGHMKDNIITSEIKPYIFDGWKKTRVFQI
jgi:predicted Co/Zn/Cd cation transporter (cation efflux family)